MGNFSKQSPEWPMHISTGKRICNHEPFFQNKSDEASFIGMFWNSRMPKVIYQRERGSLEAWME